MQGQDVVLSKSTQKLLRTLNNDPSLASHVRRFVCSGENTPRAASAYGPLLREVLEVCSGAVSLCLYLPSPSGASTSDRVALSDSVKEALKVVRARLVELDLNNMTSDSKVHAYLATFPRLKRLAVGELEDERIGALLPASALL